MKSIKTIIGKNIKGRSFNVELGPVNVICGRNFTGKTSIIDALKLTSFGYHPTLGNKPNLTMELTDANELIAAVEMSDGSTTKRRWTRNAKGKCTADPVEGQGVALSALMLDINVFFGMTGPQRMNYIFQRCDIGETFIKRVFEMIENLQFKYAEARSVRDQVFTHMQTSTGVLQNRDGDSVPKLIERLIENAQQQAKEFDAEVKRLTAIVTAPNPDNDAEDPRIITEEIEAKRAALSKVKEDRAVLLEKRRAATRSADRINLLTEAAEADVEGEDVLAELTMAAESLKAELGEFADKSESECRRAEIELAADANRYNKEIADLEKKIELFSAGAFPEVCECCGASGKQYIARMKKQADDRVAALTAKLVARREDLETVVSEAALYAKRRTLVTKFSQIDKINEAIERRENAAAELKTIQVDVPAIGKDTDQLELLNKSEELITAELSELNVSYRSAIAHHERVRSIEEAGTKKMEMEIGVEVCKEIVKALKSAQNECLNKSVGALLETANLFVRDILPGDLKLVDGELGMTAGSETHKTFSGTEQALAYMALAIALASRDESRIAVVDELGRLDLETKKLFIGRIVAAVDAGKLDQFIGVDVSADAYCVDHVINTETVISK